MKILRRLLLPCAILLWCCACHGPHIASGPKTDEIPAETRPDTLQAAPQAASDSLVKPAPTDSTDLRTTPGQDIASALHELVSDPLFERTQLGLYVYDLTDDRPLFSRGHQQRLRPASTMKPLTAITGLHCLGTDYLFATTLYADNNATQDSVLRGHLYVRAGFDPLFDKADLQTFVDSLTKQGVRSSRGGLVVDLHCKDRLPAAHAPADRRTRPLCRRIYRPAAPKRHRFYRPNPGGERKQIGPRNLSTHTHYGPNPAADAQREQ